MNGASQIEIDVLVLSAAIVVIPLLLMVAVDLVRRSRIRRRPPVSFLEVIGGKS